MNRYLTLSLMGMAVVTGTAYGMDKRTKKLELTVRDQENKKFKVKTLVDNKEITLEGKPAEEFVGGFLNTLDSVQQAADGQIIVVDHMVPVVVLVALQNAKPDTIQFLHNDEVTLVDGAADMFKQALSITTSQQKDNMTVIVDLQKLTGLFPPQPQPEAVEVVKIVEKKVEYEFASTNTTILPKENAKHVISIKPQTDTNIVTLQVNANYLQSIIKEPTLGQKLLNRYTVGTAITAGLITWFAAQYYSE